MSDYKITIDMIQKFTILDPCYKTCPCQHDCTIELTDGRKRNVCLYSPSIEALIQKIPLEKIYSSSHCHPIHRHQFSNDPWGNMGHVLDKISSVFKVDGLAGTQELPQSVEVDMEASKITVTKKIGVRITELVPLIEQTVACLPKMSCVCYQVGQGHVAYTFKDSEGEVRTKLEDCECGTGGLGMPLKDFKLYQYDYQPKSYAFTG